MFRALTVLAVIGLLVLPTAAQQPTVKVGFVVDITGPASSLGVPERNTVLMYQDDFATTQSPAGPVRI
ncbi:MAG: ABC transporter substrate-binding protein, partial [bacterium]